MADFTFAHRKEGFDTHIEKSIRGYSDLVNDVISLSRYFLEDFTNVVDIGCSTGKMLESMQDNNKDFAPMAEYIGVENAEGFRDSMKERVNRDNHLDLVFNDIRDYTFENCSLITSLFTLQFMPKRDRQEVIEKIYDGLNPDGAFIFAEKIVAENSRIQEMMTFNFYDFKRKNFSTDDIMDKEKTLRSMLKPNTWEELVDMLNTAGFHTIQPFWQNHMFMGAVVIK